MFSRHQQSRRAPILLGLSCLFLAGLGTASLAQTASYSVTGWDFDPATGDYTLGYTFTPTQNVAVTSLGEWVTHDPSGGPGTINASENVGIFDDAGNLLFSTAFTQANATITGNTLASGSEFRYVDITSAFSESARTLIAGQSYTIGGSIGNNSTGANSQGFTPNPNITITSAGLYAIGNTVSGPTPTPPGSAGGFNYGINFQSTAVSAAAATPEPGSIALLTGLAVSGGAFALRRRRKA